MKVKIIVLSCVCISAIIVTGVVTSAHMKNGDKKKTTQPVKEEFYYDNGNKEMFTDEEISVDKGQDLLVNNDELFISDDVVAERMISDIAGKEESLKYEGTKIFENAESSDLEQLYGVYDQYSDNNDSVYYYLHSSDKLCLFMKEYEYEEAEENQQNMTYSDSEVKEIADAYAEKMLETDFLKYSFYNLEYQEQKQIYLVTYIRRIGDYITDDSLTVFIDENKEVYAFSAMNRNRFDNFSTDDIEEESLNNALLAVEAGEYGIDDIRITIDVETQQLVAVLPQ